MFFLSSKFSRVQCNWSSGPWYPDPSFRTKTDTTYRYLELYKSQKVFFLPEMRKRARMLKQKRFAAHRKAAKRTGEDDFLSVCHLSLRFHQVLEQDHRYLSKGSWDWQSTTKSVSVSRYQYQSHQSAIHNVPDQVVNRISHTSQKYFEIKLKSLVLVRISDPQQSNADPDPDPAFHFNADPDPALHFNASPNPAPHQDDENLGLQTLQASI